MNENLDLIKVLKDCPVGTKLYSPIFGEVEYNGIETTTTSDSNGYSSFIRVKACGGYRVFFSFNQEGKYYLAGDDGECMLFPAKDQRDWSKFNPNVKPIFHKGDRIVDIVRNNGYEYEILDVLEDRYKVTGFGTLLFSEQDGFALAPVQIEFVEPQKMYWFIWRGESAEPLLQKLLELIDSAYKPVNIHNDDLVYNNGNEIKIARETSLGAALVRAVGIELRIKEK